LAPSDFTPFLRLQAASAFCFAVAFFYAPLAYGCTRPEMLPTLYLLLGAGIVLAAAAKVVQREAPLVPRTAGIAILLLLAQGWWLTASPVFGAIIAHQGGTSAASLDDIRELSWHAMLMITVTLGTFVALCDLFAEATLRRFLLLAAAISGVLVAFVGVTLKIGGKPLMLYVWKDYDVYWTEFALYHYHGNAAAFLNLAWPLVLVFARRTYGATGETFLGKRVVWSAAAMVMGAALFLNASKAGLAIGLLILPWPFSSGLKRLQAKTLFALGVGTMLLLAGALLASSQLGHEAAFRRILEPTEFKASLGGRLGAYREYLHAVPSAGAFGLGPGLFQLAFPFQNNPLGNTQEGLREYAHQDFLQTALEWGWFGTFWWTVLVAGGLYRGLRAYLKRERFASRTERHLVLAGVLGVLGTLVQSCFDFPLQIASIRLPFLVLLALCWIAPRLLVEPERAPRMRYRLPIPADPKRLTSASR
jgi:hypothetical protein